MRFYKNRQAEMLNRLGYFLKQNSEKLSEKVPAMKDFIGQYLEMEKALYAVIIANPNLVFMNTMEKQSVKKEFVKAIAKLIAVLNAAGYQVKDKPLPEMNLSVYEINKLSADKLGRTYVEVFAAVKKIRNLQYYGLSEGDMRDMQAYYKEFSGIKNAPTLKKKEVALNNRNLERGVKECINFLKKHIDGMMLIAAEEDAYLLMEYKALRKVLPRAQGRPSEAEAAYRKSRGHAPSPPRD